MAMLEHGGRRYNFNPFAALALERNGWSAPCSGCLIPRKDLEPIIQALVGLGAALDGHENSFPYHDLIPGPSSLWQVAVVTALSWLLTSV